MKRFLLLIFIIVFVGSGAYKLYSLNQKEDIPEKVIKIQQKIQNFSLSGEIIDGVRVINIKAFQYSFDPDPIVVNKGESVKFIVDSVDVVHGFAISSYNIFESDIFPGSPREIEFVANNAGKFETTCSTFCGGGHREMEAVFIVKEVL